MYFIRTDCSIREYQSDFNSLCWYNMLAYDTSKQANHYKVQVRQQVWKAPWQTYSNIMLYYLSHILCRTSNSCNMGISALPDTHALCLGHATPESKYRHIKQCTSAVLQLIYMLCYCHSKNLPELAIDCFAY